MKDHKYILASSNGAWRSETRNGLYSLVTSQSNHILESSAWHVEYKCDITTVQQ